MNEFTKEELEDLISWGNVYTGFSNNWTDKLHRPLIDKLHSMIDNYQDEKMCGNKNCRLSSHPSNVECVK